MSTKRIPIHRPIRAQIPLEALNLFREMKNVGCACPPIDWKGRYWERQECPGCERWRALHSRLAQLLPGIRPWHWPVIQSPRVQCPYPAGSNAAGQWRTAQARWRELEAALKGTQISQKREHFSCPRLAKKEGDAFLLAPVRRRMWCRLAQSSR
jgi:hypothetical protein